MYTLEFDVGSSAPRPHAAGYQEASITNVDSTDPQGGTNAPYEPFLNVFLSAKWRVPLQRENGRGLRFRLHSRIAGVGETHGPRQRGGQAGFCWNLPNDFGTYEIRTRF
jgi:hypothetical protein